MSSVNCVPVTVRDRSEASHTTASEISPGSARGSYGNALPTSLFLGGPAVFYERVLDRLRM
jgi:hypothetical protein